MQHRLMFFPDKFYASPKNAGAEEFVEKPLVMYDGTMVMSWYYKGNKDKPVILFFHGNAGQIATFAPYLSAYTKAGYSVMALEYRGFGKTCGKIEEDVAFADGIWAFDYLRQKLGHKNIVIMGYSMGSAIAVGVSKYKEPDAMVLLAPFSSMQKLVTEQNIPFASLVLKDKFLSVEYIKNFSNPLFIMHGQEDSLIGVHHAKILYDKALAKDKSLKILPNQEHNELFFKQQNHLLVIDWLNSL